MRARGSIPGLLQLGSIVVADGSDVRGVVSGPLGYDTGRPHLIGVAYGFVLHTGTPDRYSLDLTCEAGMDRAARYLAEKVGLKCGATAPQWRGNANAGWRLTTHDTLHTPSTLRWFGEDEGCIGVTDPAEALALAIEHVAGSPS